MKISNLSLALTLALTLGTTFTVAHAETASTSNTPYAYVKDTDAIAKTATPVTLSSIKADPTATTMQDNSTETVSNESQNSTLIAAQAATSTATSTIANENSTTVATTEKVTADTKTAAKATAPLIKKEDLPAGVYTDTLSHWSRTPVQYMSNKGYISGFSDGSFQPNEPITREQVAAIYSKILKSKVSEKELSKLTTKAQDVTYSDVTNDQWSAEPIALVSAAGIMEGTSKTNFKPAETLTREEFAVTAANLAKELNLKSKSKVDKVTFKDGASINKSAKASIDTLAREGFIASGDSVMFRPTGEISRAEASTILYRMVSNNPIKVSEKTTADGASTATVAETTNPAKVDNMTDSTNTTATPTQSTSKSTKATTVAALTEKQQVSLEDKVFTELNKLYKTPEDFQKYGVMYWRDNTLHVALKSDTDIATTQANLASRNDSTINKYVFVEPSQYSQLEYDTIDSNFRKYYATHEKTGQILATFPDVGNNQLYAVVSTATATTQQNVVKAFGDKVKMSVKH